VKKALVSKDIRVWGVLLLIFFTLFFGCENILENKPDLDDIIDDGDKIHPQVTWPTGLRATQGWKLADVSLDDHANHNGEPGVFSWTTPHTELGDLGEQEHSMTFTPEDTDSYRIVSKHVTIHVIDECLAPDWGDWEVTQEPTNTVDGVETRTCTNTGATETRPLWATGTEGLTYTLINGGAAYSVIRGTKALTEIPTLHIPAYWRPADSDNYDDYKPVTQIGNGNSNSNGGTFGGTNNGVITNTTLTTLTFAENRQPTIIESATFWYCTALSKVTIPAGVTMKNHAFRNCTGLTELTLNEGVTIGETAFESCTGLTELTIPEGVTISGFYAFQNCTGLTSVTISSSNITGILTFNGCTSLERVTISAGVTSIQTSMISSNCPNVIGITVDPNNSHYASDDNGILYNKAKTEIIYFPPKFSGTFTVPTSVTSINGTFWNHTGITSVTLHERITIIGDSTFRNCANLTSVTLPESLMSIGQYAFLDCKKLTSITIPEGVTSIGNQAFSGCASLTSITIPANVTFSGSSVFSGCTSLESVIISEGVTSIPSFGNCTNLASITIPTSVTSIIASAFINCTSLTSITIPEGVTSIGNSAFSGCTGLISITIPASVTSIGTQVFNNCTSLTSVTFNGNSTTIGNSAFSGCTSLTSIIFPASVTSIGTSVFLNCKSLTSITIPASVTTIGNSAFSGCTSLTSVTFNGSSTNIGYTASFPNNLKTVYDQQTEKSGTYVLNGTTWSKQ